MGPVHTFNGHTAIFYISTGQGSCSINQDAKTDADYFCSSFYGTDYTSTSYEVGKYSNSGSSAPHYQMHKKDGCSSAGEDIDSTDCSGVKCRIWSTSSDHNGLFNIICSNTPGTIIDILR